MQEPTGTGEGDGGGSVPFMRITVTGGGEKGQESFLPWWRAGGRYLLISEEGMDRGTEPRALHRARSEQGAGDWDWDWD